MKKLIQPFGLFTVFLLIVAGGIYSLVSNIQMYNFGLATAEVTVTIQIDNMAASVEGNTFTTSFSLNNLQAGTYKLGAADRLENCTVLGDTQSINISAESTASVNFRLQCNSKPNNLWRNTFVFLIYEQKVAVMYQMGKKEADIKLLNDSDFYYNQANKESKIVFQKDDNIWMLHTVSRKFGQLTEGGNARQPDWSPDGSKIAFSRATESNREIFMMDEDGTSAHNVTQSPADDTAPSWSPDGLKIAFTSDRDGDKEIFVIYPKTNNTRQLTQNKRADHSASWSADGRKIVFVGEGWTGVQHIYLAGFNGKIFKQLLSFPNSMFRDKFASHLSPIHDIEYSKARLLPLKSGRIIQPELLTQLADR